MIKQLHNYIPLRQPASSTGVNELAPTHGGVLQAMRMIPEPTRVSYCITPWQVKSAGRPVKKRKHLLGPPPGLIHGKSDTMPHPTQHLVTIINAHFRITADFMHTQVVGPESNVMGEQIFLSDYVSG